MPTRYTRNPDIMISYMCQKPMNFHGAITYPLAPVLLTLSTHDGALRKI